MEGQQKEILVKDCEVEKITKFLKGIEMSEEIYIDLMDGLLDQYTDSSVL